MLEIFMYRWKETFMSEHINIISAVDQIENSTAVADRNRGDFGPLVLFQGQSITFVSFGLLVGMGAILGLIHSWFYLGGYQIIGNTHQSNQLALALALGTPLSAYVVTRLLDLNTWLSGEKTFLEYIRTVSFGLWGGLIGGLFILISFALSTGTSLLALMDSFAVGVPLAQALGRLACLNYGCCHGKECHPNSRFGISYHNPQAKVLRFDAELRGKRLHPTQIYSVLANLTIYAIVLVLALSWDARPVGVLAAVYMTLYGLKRFSVELLRGEFPRVYFSGLTIWQWFSLSFITLGLSMMVYVFTQGTLIGAVNYANGFQNMKSALGVLIFAASFMGLAYGTHGKKIGSW
jgi:phosphatidylglycerol:prolipoprotein diacylglycerol transferase